MFAQNSSPLQITKRPAFYDSLRGLFSLFPSLSPILLY
jgi:hypothetical protein